MKVVSRILHYGAEYISRTAAYRAAGESIVRNRRAVKMKKYSLFLISVLIFIGAAYAQVQIKEVEPKKQFKRVEPTKPEKLEIPTIKVLSPNGGETWVKGKPYTIRWTSKGLKGNVKITLEKWQGQWYTIAESAPNTGRYSYTVPKSMPEGDIFLVYVMTSDGKVKDRSDRSFRITAKKEITVLHPNGGEELVQGTEFRIRWKSSGKIGPVKILIEDEKGVKHLLARTGQSASPYKWRVSPKLRTEKYKLIIASRDEKIKDESDGRFEIIPPEIELTCGFLEYGRIIKGKNYIFAAERKTYMKFTVFVQNNGTTILNRVPFMWTILKQPLSDVVLQGEAGFGNVYPNRRYSTTFKFNYKKYARAWFLEKRKREFKKGDYRFVFEVDPRNELHEPEWARENNKCEATFSIE